MAYIGKQPVVGNFVKLDAIVTSATATYNLLNGGVAYFPQTANNCIVSLNGVIQSPTSAYTISGSTIVFSDALTASDSIDFILVLGDVLSIGTPSDNTVSLAKLTATGTKDATTFLRGDNTFATAGGNNAPYFQAYRGTSAQTLTGGSWTKIQINTEIIDSASAYDNSTNYRFTPLSSGKYYIFGQVTSATSTDMDRVMSSIYFNGSALSQTNSFNGDSSSAYTATIVDMNGSTDYVELYGYFGVGASTDIQNRATFFGGFKLIG